MNVVSNVSTNTDIYSFYKNEHMKFFTSSSSLNFHIFLIIFVKNILKLYI